MASIYDYPEYYDILFGWDRDAEAGFYDAVFRDAGLVDGSRILEVACGTGQVAVRLARHGWQVTGLDISADMLAFLVAAATHAGVSVRTICADMATFTTDDAFDGAYSPMSSFRLLPDDEAALAHLSAMARALRPGGVYVMDMAFANRDLPKARPSVGEWTMTRDGVTVAAVDDVIRVDDPAAGGKLTLDWGDAPLREYTCESFIRLVGDWGAYAMDAYYPVARTSEDGVGIFDVRCRKDPPLVGRAMVALRRS